jgi:hypothetical protein
MKEKEGVNTRISTHTGETPSAFFKQHQHKERERGGTIYTKLYQTERERRKKKWIFRQKSC